MTDLVEGRIVWIWVRRNGVTKKRPALVLFVDDVAQTVDGVAISTTFNGDRPPTTYVPLPFHPSGQSGTKLRRASWAVTDWPVLDVPLADVDELGGMAPLAVVRAVLEKMKNLP